jgi:hypothetical protein
LVPVAEPPRIEIAVEHARYTLAVLIRRHTHGGRVHGAQCQLGQQTRERFALAAARCGQDEDVHGLKARLFDYL